jgi:nitrous oxidase accessory protein NosD
MAGGSGATPNTAWSLSHAVAAALPGDVVLVAGGVYAGKFTISATGTESEPITFLASGTNGPAVIDGTGLASDHDGLFFIQTFGGTTRGNVKIIGFEFRNYTVQDGSGIRLVASNNGTISNVEIRNCRIHHILGTNAMGITVYGTNPNTAIRGVIIDGCEIFNCEPASSETIAINGNIDGFSVTNCHIRDCNNIGIDAIGGESGLPVGNSPGKVARNGIISHNRIERCIAGGASAGIAAAGIYVDGGRDIVIENNVITECDFGIEVGAENAVTTTGVVVRQNVMAKNRFNGLIFGAPGFSSGSVSGCLFQNNLLYRNDSLNEESAEIQIQSASGSTIENNVVHANGDSNLTFIYADDPLIIQGETLRNNWFYSTLGPDVGSYSWDSEAWGYAEFTATGANPGGGFGNPLLVDPENGDYHLAPISPCIDRGHLATNIAPGTLTDTDGLPRLRGTAPDCGIDEVFPVDGWFRTTFPGQGLSPPRLAADSDKDGASDFMEYAAGFDPKSATSMPRLLISSKPERTLELTYFRNPAATDTVMLMLNGSNASPADLLTSPTPSFSSDGPARLKMTWTLPPPEAALPRRFFAVKAALVP